MTRRALAAAAVAAYTALATLVAAGTLAPVDEWAVRHLMPGGSDSSGTPTFAESVVPLLHASFDRAFVTAAELTTLPGQVVVSFLLLCGAALALLRRGRPAAAIVWPTAWLAGTAVEVLCKGLLERPALDRHGHHLVAYDASWPSGHTIRILLVAAAFAAVWPRARALVWLWAVAALALLEASGAHTPSDIAGGALLALLLGLAAVAAERSALVRRGAARALRARPARAPARRP